MSDTQNNVSQIRSLLTTAEIHFNRGEWAQADACFDRVLELDPQNKAAFSGRSDVREKREREAEIQAKLKEGQDHLDALRFREAINAFNGAQDVGASHGILIYHAEIRTLRDRAQDALAWRTTVDEGMAKARKLEEGSQTEPAIVALRELLHSLTANGQDELAEPVRAELARLVQTREVEDQIHEAQQAFDEQDLERACQIAQELERRYGDRADVKRIAANFCRRWTMLSEQLQQAQTYLTDGKLEDAVAMLAKVRGTVPKNPNWQALWLRAHSDQGHSLMAQARAALVQQDFSVVGQLVATATTAFTAVLDVFPNHQPSERALAEMEVWGPLTTALLQARRDELALQWDAALSMLEQASGYAGAARAIHDKEAGSKAYADVEGMLKSIEARILAARQRINEARTALRDGEEKLAQRRIDHAIEFFRRGLEVLGDLPEDALENALLMRQREAVAQRDRVTALLQRAQSETESAQVIATLREVYDAWPTAPGMPALLGDRLLAEVDAAVVAQRNDLAADYARQIMGLDLLPGDMKQKAQGLLDQLDCTNLVMSAVRTALQRHNAASQSQALPALTEYREIMALLVEAGERAKRNCSEKAPEVAGAVALVQPMLLALEKAEPAIVAARAAQGRGDWDAAATQWMAAVTAMGERCPAVLRTEAEQATERTARINEQFKIASQALKDAQAVYQAGAGGMLQEIDWVKFFDDIGAAVPALDKIKEAAQPAPAALTSLEKQCADLQSRGRLLREVADYVRGGQETEALRLLGAASEQFPGDTVITAIFAQMRQAQSETTRVRAEEILDEVRASAMRGDWEGALERLNEARTLDISPGEIEREVQRINRQRQTWAEITQYQLDAEQKRATNSRLDAKRAYDEAIMLASFPESGLEPELRTALSDLRSYFNTMLDPTMFARQGVDLVSEARATLDRIVRSGSRNPLTGRLSALAKDWYDISVAHARFGYVSSAEALGSLEEAYAVAKEQLRDTPGDSEITQKVTELRTRILEHLQGSVTKRITRAENNASQGNFDGAQKDLTTVDDIVAPIKSRFPEIGDDDTIQQQLQRAVLMEAQVAKLQQRAKQLTPLVEQINLAYVGGKLTEAERLINEAEVIDPDRSAKFLWEQIDSLQRLIRRRHQAGTVEKLDDLLMMVRVRMETDESITLTQLRAEVLSPLEEELTKVRGLDKDQWGDRQQEFESLLARARERYRNLQEAELSWQTAQERIAAEAWEDAFKALERGQSLVRGQMRENIQREIERIKPLAEIQRKRREAIEGGKRSLSMRRFTDAIDNFASAIQLDAPRAEIQPYLAAAQAGEYLDRAGALMVTNPKEAERLLKDAIRLAGEAAPAEEYRREAEANLAEITQRLEHAANIATMLQMAEAALAKDQLQAASDALDAILQLDQGHPSAQDLKRKVNEAGRAQTLLAGAAGLYEEKRYREAIELVEQSLTIYPLTAAQQLAAKLHAEQDAGEALTRAQSLAQEGRFVEARRELQSARDKNPNHPRLPEAQQALKDMEEQYFVRVRRPIEDAYRRKNYREAVRASEAAMKTVDLADWKAELQQRLQTILEEWSRQLAGDAQQLMAQPDNEQTDKLLAQSIEQLNEALAAAAGGSERTKQELRSLIVQLEVRCGLLRLSEGERLLASPTLTASDLRRCEQIAQEVVKKAEALNDFELEWKAEDFRQHLDERRQATAQSERDSRFQSARQTFDQAKTAADLDLALQRVNEILGMPGYNADAEAIHLRGQINEELRRLRATTDKLDNAKRSLRNGNYGGAQDTLQMIDEPSRLLRSDLERLLNLVADLINAEDQEAPNPQLALEIYEKAGASGFDLGPTLTNAMRRCRNNLIEKVEGEVNALLRTVVPDVQAAQQRLRQVRERGWVQSVEQEQRLAQLELLAGRKAQVAQAIRLLEQAGNAVEAATLLEAVCQQTPQSELEKSDEGWLFLAQARAALDSGRLDETARLLQMPPSALRDTAVYIQLHADLTQAQQTAQHFSAAAAKLDQLLTSTPPNYGEAVLVARQLPPGNSLIRRVRGALEEAITRRRQAEDYLAVRGLVDNLRALLREDDTAATDLLAASEAERNEKLAATLLEIETALGQDDTDLAERLAARIRRLDVDNASARFVDLERRLRERQPVLAEMRQHIQAAQDAMLKAEYTQAVAAALQAQQLVSNHPAVLQLLDDLRARLRTAIDQRVASGHFSPALQLCDQALRLGPDPAFTTLRFKIEADRRTAIDRAATEATQALLLFDLTAAEKGVATVRTIQLDDIRVGRLERQLEERKQAAPQLREAMIRGWDALQRRDFDAAGEQFRIAASAVADFEEPQLWRSYVTNVKEGIALVLNEQYDVAVTSFAQAETGLRFAATAMLSPLWSTRLEQERRRAVYNAMRLRERSQEMLEARLQGDAAKEQRKNDFALQKLNQLRGLRNEFPNYARTVFEPGPDFDAGIASGNARQLHAEPAQRSAPPPTAAARTTSSYTPPPPRAAVATDSDMQRPAASSEQPVSAVPAATSPKTDTQPLPLGTKSATDEMPPTPPEADSDIDVAAWDDFFGEHDVKPIE